VHNPRRLLLVEDEPGLVMTLTDRLIAEGYEVQSVMTAPDGLEAGTTGAFDIILLDVMLPGGNGLDVCRELRQRGIQSPVLMLTARGQVFDKVVGLKLGADDYVVKPFEMAELLARIEAVLRRSTATTTAPGQPGGDSYRFGDVTIDFRKAEVVKNGVPVELSALEFKLLRYFIEHKGAVLSRDELLNEVWGYDAMPSTRTVELAEEV
jgi:two-component system alkaline phosphatase synthesis response regulator PhoP